MAGPNLPSISELGQMEFLSPLAYQQAQRQVDLASQFADQGLASGQQDLQAKQLANMFQQQADPMRLQAMGLANESATNANAISGVNSRIATGTEEEAKAAKRAELLSKASEDELKKLRTQAEKEYESEDPVVRARGEKKLMASVAELKRRQKLSGDIEIANAQGANRLAGIGMQQEGMNQRNDATIAARLAAAREKAMAGKKANENFQQAGARYMREAAEATNPEEQQQKLEMARTMVDLDMNARQAVSGGKIDAGAATGLPTRSIPNAVPNGIRNLPPMTNGAGDPPPGAGIVTPADEAHRRAVTQLSPLEEQFVNETDPRRKAALEQQIKQAAGQPAQAPAAPAKPQAPPAGTIYKGYRFKGGNPADKANWEKV